MMAFSKICFEVVSFLMPNALLVKRITSKLIFVAWKRFCSMILHNKCACCEEQIDPQVDIKECTVDNCISDLFLETSLQQIALEDIDNESCLDWCAQ